VKPRPREMIAVSLGKGKSVLKNVMTVNLRSKIGAKNL
jgi:hypothetical protein